MQITDILRILSRRRWIILVTLGVCLGLSILLTALMPPTYETVATLRIQTPGVDPNSGYISFNYADRLTATFLSVLESTEVSNQLKQQLGVEELPPISIEILGGTELLEVRVSDRDPRIANTFAEVIVANAPSWLYGDITTRVESLQTKLQASTTTLADLRQQFEDLFDSANPNRNTADVLQQAIALEQENYITLLREYQQASLQQERQRSTVTLVELAREPEAPSSPRRTLNIALGLVSGLLGGLGLAVLFENLDTALYSTTQVERATSARIIGQIPTGRRQRVASLRLAEPTLLEGFRSLRANVLSETTGFRTLLFTSAQSRSGKSTVAANLAATVARSMRNVVLIDANLHSPALHQIFGLQGEAGLSDVLVGTIGLEESLQLAEQQLYVLTVGTATEAAADLLNSERMRTLLRQLSRQFDLVLFDTSAVGSLSDALSLAPLVDGVVVVVERTRTKAEELSSVVSSLNSVGARVAGIVVNRAEKRPRLTGQEAPARTIGRRIDAVDTATMRAVSANGSETEFETIEQR
jgi:non-specific protein-tyrosine kinase